MICLDATKLVLLRFFTLVETIFPKILAKLLPNNAKSLPHKCVCISSLMACSRQCHISQQKQPSLLADKGTFRLEGRLPLSKRNSILSEIWSGALVGRRSSYIVLAIVYERQTNEKRSQRSNVNAMNLPTKQSIFVEYILLWQKHLSFAGVRSPKNTKLYRNRPGET